MTPTGDEPSAEDPDPTVRTRYTVDEPPSTVIATAIAILQDAPPVELDPLYETVDPDALDAVLGDPYVDESESALRVTFTVSDCHVIAHSDGRITVTDERHRD